MNKELNSMSKEVNKVVNIKLNKDYGGVIAWTFKETFNGLSSDPNSFKVLNREHFNDLQNVIEDYLVKGFSINIENKM
tara:strand:+ start:1841 stop:2074 length:234 start_codon:yes stop_codon:yes gene_type:complete